MSARKSRTASTVASTGTSTDTLARTDEEGDVDYITRLVSIGTAESIAAARDAFTVAEDIARLVTFEGRVQRCVMIGRIMVGDVTLRDGEKPEDFEAVAKSLEVSSKSGEYLGYKYAKLSEAYRIARDYTPESMADFIAAYRAETGENPEQVRHYVKYAYAVKNPDGKRAETVVEDLGKRIEKEATDAIEAAERAAERAALIVTLAKAGHVEGFPVTPEEWKGTDEETLKKVSLLADHLAKKLGKARRAAERASAENTAASETGPASATPAKRARTKVSA